MSLTVIKLLIVMLIAGSYITWIIKQLRLGIGKKHALMFSFFLEIGFVLLICSPMALSFMGASTVPQVIASASLICIFLTVGATIIKLEQYARQPNHNANDPEERP